ncbi:MAG: hypothetical protein AAF961_12085, partial [Planctomycetota bacterium]
RRSVRQTTVCLIGSALAISAALYLWRPDIVVYRGLSGIDSALFAMLAVNLLAEGVRNRSRAMQVIAVTLAVAFFGKTVFELATDHTLFVDCGAAQFEPIALAHAVGGAAGTLAAVVTPRSAVPRRPLPAANCRC